MENKRNRAINALTKESIALAYAVYGMIRAMIDDDFAQTPEQLLSLDTVKEQKP